MPAIKFITELFKSYYSQQIKTIKHLGINLTRDVEGLHRKKNKQTTKPLLRKTKREISHKHAAEDLVL